MTHPTKTALIALIWTAALSAAVAQPAAPAAAASQSAPLEDFKPSSLNQPGQQYPMVNS